MPIDMSAAKAPPRKATGARKAATRTLTVDESSAILIKRESGLQDLAMIGGALLAVFGQHADSMAINMHAGPVLHETAKLSEKYEWLANGIDMAIKATPFTALLTAAMPLALQIGANHGWVKPGTMMGITILPPDVLEMQQKAHMARVAAEQMKAQQEAREQAEAAMRDAEQMLAGVTAQ